MIHLALNDPEPLGKCPLSQPGAHAPDHIAALPLGLRSLGAARPGPMSLRLIRFLVGLRGRELAKPFDLVQRIRSPWARTSHMVLAEIPTFFWTKMPGVLPELNSLSNSKIFNDLHNLRNFTNLNPEKGWAGRVLPLHV